MTLMDAQASLEPAAKPAQPLVGAVEPEQPAGPVDASGEGGERNDDPPAASEGVAMPLPPPSPPPPPIALGNAAPDDSADAPPGVPRDDLPSAPAQPAGPAPVGSGTRPHSSEAAPSAEPSDAPAERASPRGTDVDGGDAAQPRSDGSVARRPSPNGGTDAPSAPPPPVAAPTLDHPVAHAPDERPPAVARAAAVQRTIEAERDAAVQGAAAKDVGSTSASAGSRDAAGERIHASRSPTPQALEGPRMSPAAAPIAAPVIQGDSPTPGAISTTATSDGDAEAAPAPLVARGLAAIAAQKGGTLQMRLDPPSLGDVRITMSIRHGVVVADITVAQANAHALLAADLGSLHAALERQGLVVDRLSLHAPLPAASRGGEGLAVPNGGSGGAGDPARSDGGQARQDGSNASRHERHDAGGNASRGRGEHDPQQQRRTRRTRPDFERVWSATVGRT